MDSPWLKTFVKNGGTALAHAWKDFKRHDYLTRASALSFYFLISIFPLLIFLANALAWVPIPNLFDEIMSIMAVVVPPDAMGVIRGVLQDVLQKDASLLSVGFIGAIFSASVGFAAMIDALNVAYDVGEGRPFWKKRLVAIELTLFTGLAVLLALVAIALGPQFGDWLTRALNLGPIFAAIWPYLRWTAIVLFTVLSIEAVYYLAPNVKQRFVAQIPGAAFAVIIWLAASWGLNLYLRTFANHNKTFGALGAVVALMLWFYVSALAILVGAELNSELIHTTGNSLDEKQPSITPASDAWQTSP